MPVLIALAAVVQAYFVYHVYRSGRPFWWAFVILSVPVLGCIAYYLLQVFPGSREHYSARMPVSLTTLPHLTISSLM